MRDGTEVRVKKKLPWGAYEPAGNRYHGDIAESYLVDRINVPPWQEEDDALVHFLSPTSKGSRVLDVPFGTGRFAQHYIAKNLLVSAIEISSDMLRVARQEVGPAFDSWDVREGDAFKLPFPDAYFDVAVCVRFVESIIPFGRATEFLAELRRVTKGYAIVRLNNRLDDQPPVRRPGAEDKMGARLYIHELKEMIGPLGWAFTDSVSLMKEKDGRGEKRTWRLDAV
jgi:SAM-dependent methyltransferase